MNRWIDHGLLAALVICTLTLAVVGVIAWTSAILYVAYQLSGGELAGWALTAVLTWQVVRLMQRR